MIKKKKMMMKDEKEPAQEAKIPPDAVAPKDDKSEEMKEMDAKRHYDVLMEAEEIKKDPAKMEGVKKHAGRHLKAITSIQDLKDLHDAKFGDMVNKKPMQHMA